MSKHEYFIYKIITHIYNNTKKTRTAQNGDAGLIQGMCGKIRGPAGLPGQIESATRAA